LNDQIDLDDGSRHSGGPSCFGEILGSVLHHCCWSTCDAVVKRDPSKGPEVIIEPGKESCSVQ
jgi:hypothetical protein